MGKPDEEIVLNVVGKPSSLSVWMGISGVGNHERSSEPDRYNIVVTAVREPNEATGAGVQAPVKSAFNPHRPFAMKRFSGIKSDLRRRLCSAIGQIQ